MRVPGNCPGDDMSLFENQDKGMELLGAAYSGSVGERCFSDTTILTHHLEQITDSNLLCLWKLRMNGRIHTELGVCDAEGDVMQVIDEQMLKIAMDPDRYR